jgi:hypothetical protein
MTVPETAPPLDAHAMAIPVGMSVAGFVRSLAEEHGVVYVPGPYDAWANKVTELCGDEVVSDDIDNLILALRRTNVITKQQRMWLIVACYKERQAAVEAEGKYPGP